MDAIRRPPPQDHARGSRRVLDRRWLEYLKQTGKMDDAPGIAADPAFRSGIDEFNTGHFFESHETWEAIWHQTPYPEQLFLLGLTKVAAGLAHLQRQNAWGARRLLEDGVRFLDAFSVVYAGIDLERLRLEVRHCVEAGGGCLRNPPKILAARR